jgi:hypothetical protein
MKAIKAIYGILTNPNYGSYIYNDYIARVAADGGILEALSCITPALNALYSGLDVNVYPTRILEGTNVPAVVLTQISRVAKDTSTGYSKSDISRIQIDCVGNTPTEAFELSEKVRLYMSAIVPRVYNEVLVQNIAFDDEQIIMDDNFGTEGATMVSQDYLIMYAN